MDTCGQCSWNFKFFLENFDAASSVLKRRETTQFVISILLKYLHLWWYVGAVPTFMMCYQIKFFFAY